MPDEPATDYERDEPVPDEAVLLRGGPLDFQRLHDAAREPQVPHGFCGLSLFGFPGISDVAEAFECSPLRYPEVHAVTAAEVREAGFEVRRTFRKRGHCSLIFPGEPSDEDIDTVIRLLGPSYTIGGE